MIATLTGSIQSLEAAGIVLDVSGVGYRVMLSARDAGQCAVDQHVRVHIYHHIREDAQQLFGFLDIHDLRVFGKLITVSGIGPKIAQAILSQLSGIEVINAILMQQVDTFKRVSGVGKKTAERLVLELRDAFRTNVQATGVASESVAMQDSQIDVVQALLALGYAEVEIYQVVRDLDVSLSLSEQVREALRILSSHTRYAR